MKFWLGWILGLFFLIPTLLGTNTGCAGGASLSNSIKQGSDQMTGLLAVMAKKVDEQGMLDKWAMAADAHANNPRAVAGVSIEMKSFYGIEGVDGDMKADAGGDSNRMSPEARAAAIAILSDPRSTPEEKAWAQGVVTWNRTHEGGNANAPPPTPNSP